MTGNTVLVKNYNAWLLFITLYYPPELLKVWIFIMTSSHWIATYEDARFIANLYVYAVRSQIDRIQEVSPEEDSFIMRQFIDIEFLLTALIRLRRCAYMLSEIPQARYLMKNAIDDFDRENPHIKPLRDITEHYDEYLRKIGRNQDIDKDIVRKGILKKILSEEDMEWMGFRVNFNSCLKSAEVLFEKVKEVRGSL